MSIYFGDTTDEELIEELQHRGYIVTNGRACMKDCIFQYATENGVVSESTDLICRADAEELWQKYVEQFKLDVSKGRNPEMAIWVDMESADDFRKMAAHWCGQDFEVRDGKMYNRSPVA